MRENPLKSLSRLPTSVVMGFLLLCLSLTLIVSPPASANSAITDARAELAETMKALEVSKSLLVIAEKELATARDTSNQIEAKLKKLYGF